MQQISRVESVPVELHGEGHVTADPHGLGSIIVDFHGMYVLQWIPTGRLPTGPQVRKSQCI